VDGQALGLLHAVIGELRVIEGHNAGADRPGMHRKVVATRLTAGIGDGHGVATCFRGSCVGGICFACAGGSGPEEGGLALVVGVGGRFGRIAVGPVFDVDVDGETGGFDHQCAVFEAGTAKEVVAFRHFKPHCMLTHLGRLR